MTKKKTASRQKGSKTAEVDLLRPPSPEEEAQFLELCRPFLRRALSAERIVRAELEQDERERKAEDLKPRGRRLLPVSGYGHLAALFDRVGPWLLAAPFFWSRLESLTRSAKEPILYATPRGLGKQALRALEGKLKAEGRSPESIAKMLSDALHAASRAGYEEAGPRGYLLEDDLDLHHESDPARAELRKLADEMEALFARLLSREGARRRSSSSKDWIDRYVAAEAGDEKTAILDDYEEKTKRARMTLVRYAAKRTRRSTTGKRGRPPKRNKTVPRK